MSRRKWWAGDGWDCENRGCESGGGVTSGSDALVVVAPWPMAGAWSDCRARHDHGDS